MMKELKQTELRCDYCRGKQKLTLFQKADGDMILKCKYCNLTWWALNKNGTMVFVEPFEHVHFGSQQESIDRCVEIMSELV